MTSRNLYDITFTRNGLVTWQRWATSAQEARESMMRALEWEYPTEEIKIVSVEAVKRFGDVVGIQDYLCRELLGY